MSSKLRMYVISFSAAPDHDGKMAIAITTMRKCRQRLMSFTVEKICEMRMGAAQRSGVGGLGDGFGRVRDRIAFPALDHSMRDITA